MTDTKPVLTPRVGDIVRCEGWGLNMTEGVGTVIGPSHEFTVDWLSGKPRSTGDIAVAHILRTIDGVRTRYSIGLRSIVEIVRPAQEEKPKAEAATDVETTEWAKGTSPALVYEHTRVLRLIARIEADRETLKARDSNYAALFEVGAQLKAQNAEQAQEIARLRATVECWSRISKGQPLERRKGERRQHTCGWCCTQHALGQVRRSKVDRRKAK